MWIQPKINGLNWLKAWKEECTAAWVVSAQVTTWWLFTDQHECDALCIRCNCTDMTVILLHMDICCLLAGGTVFATYCLFRLHPLISLSIIAGKLKAFLIKINNWWVALKKSARCSGLCVSVQMCDFCAALQLYWWSFFLTSNVKLGCSCITQLWARFKAWFVASKIWGACLFKGSLCQIIGPKVVNYHQLCFILRIPGQTASKE